MIFSNNFSNSVINKQYLDLAIESLELQLVEYKKIKEALEKLNDIPISIVNDTTRMPEIKTSEYAVIEKSDEESFKLSVDKGYAKHLFADYYIILKIVAKTFNFKIVLSY